MNKKILPEDIVSKYTVISGGELHPNFGSSYTKSITIQDWFKTPQEANEWEAKIEQFILENRINKVERKLTIESGNISQNMSDAIMD